MEVALIKLGLSKKEASVYLAALELGEDTVQNIAKKSAVNRATTYVILEKLMGLGLVSSVEHDRKTKFIAESPSELSNILESEKREIEGRRTNLDEVMNQLMAVYNTKEGKPIVRYFEGADGLEALDRYGHDQFKKGSEMLSIAPVDLIEKQFPQRRKNALDYRIKLGIKSRLIYTHADGELTSTTNEKELREGVFIPRSEFPLNATIQIYPGWGVKFFNFNEGRYFGVLIQSPDLADNFKLFFGLAWLGAKNRKK